MGLGYTTVCFVDCGSPGGAADFGHDGENSFGESDAAVGECRCDETGLAFHNTIENEFTSAWWFGGDPSHTFIQADYAEYDQQRLNSQLNAAASLGLAGGIGGLPQSNQGGLVDAAYNPQQYDPNNPNYHYYQFTNSICVASSSCTMGNVFGVLKYFAAPGQLNAAYSGNEVQVPIAGPVMQIVDPSTYSIYNLTEDNHMFDPGWVQRSVVIDNNGVIGITTTGSGIGPDRWFNLAIARPAFTFLDTAVSQIMQPPIAGVGF